MVDSGIERKRTSGLSYKEIKKIEYMYSRNWNLLTETTISVVIFLSWVRSIPVLEGRFTRCDFAACDKLTMSLRHDLGPGSNAALHMSRIEC